MANSEFILGFMLAAGCAICWAALDITRKHLGERLSAAAAVAGLSLLQVPLILPGLLAGEWTQWSVESPTLKLLLPGLPAIPTLYWVYGLLSVGMNVVANFLFLRAVQISPLSLTTPYLSFTPVFTALVGLTIGQVPTVWGWIGISIVCLGAFFMNPGASEDGIFAPLKALWTERGSLYMLIVAGIWSVTPLVDKIGSEMTSAMWHTMVLGGGVGLFFLIFRLIRQRTWRPLWREWKIMPLFLWLAAFFTIGALVLQLGSYAYIEIAYVETIKRAIGIVAAMAAGYFLFGEEDITRRLLGASLMVAGVSIVLFGG